jgi:DNA-binding response OmpR family regulator
MPLTATEQGGPRVLLVEPNAPLRSAIMSVLAADKYQVEVCDSLSEVLQRTNGAARDVALVAWQSMNGLLSEDHRDHLLEVTSGLRLVLMVPRRWSRLLEQTDLGLAVAGVVAKPFQADELLHALDHALLTPVEA